MYTFTEPAFFSQLLESLNAWMYQSQSLSLVSFLADAPVFLYPILLVGLYAIGIRYRKKSQLTTATQYKHSALYLMSCTIGVFIINYVIKIFFQRPRPYELLDLPKPLEELTLSDIPVDSFPSDHAAVSMTIAAGLFLRGYKYNNKRYKYGGWLFAVISLIMCTGRVTIAIHRPTDILMGYLIAVCVAVLILYTRCKKPITKIRNRLVSIETVISKKIF